ncbi:MAG: alpha-amylase family glycosyl hydrolase [Solirubrobacterales bacterium]
MSEWWRNAVVYQIYPRSFQDSDGDGIGDLRGITSRLSYLRWLGVDAIWLSPIYPSPLADGGYDVSDHTAVAPELGTDEDFDHLIAGAHRNGIKVLLDLVASHTSIDHPWFRERPDFYVLADRPQNNWAASFGGSAWSPDPLRPGGFYLHSFFPEQPDLDWRNPEVREAMAAVVGHWRERGVDGFRVDAVDRLMKDADLRDDPPGTFPLPTHPDVAGLDPVHSRDNPDIGIALGGLREAAGECLLIGEVYLPDERLERYAPYFDGMFSFDLLHAGGSAEALAAVLRRARGRGDLVWATSNHDFPRVASRWGTRNASAAAFLLLCLPGLAFVYQGEEIGMVDGEAAVPPIDRFGRDGCRTPMQWEAGPGGGFTAGTPPIPSCDPELRSVEAQRGEPGSTLELFRELIAARRTIEGPLEEISAASGVLGFRRGRHRVYCNFGDEPVGIEGLAAQAVLASRGLELPAGDPSGNGVLQSGGGVLADLSIPAGLPDA